MAELKRDTNGVDHMDLRGRDLSRRDLSNFDLTGADLRDSNLSYANFENSHLEGAILTGATLYKTDLSNINAIGMVLKNTRIENCIMTMSNMFKSDFSNSIFSNCLMSCTCFRSCNFTGSGFYGSSLMSCNFQKANMTFARMAGTNLYNANFTGANLNGTDFEFANLFSATFDPDLSTYKFGKVLDEPIIVYKKAVKDVDARIYNGRANRFNIPVLVTLEIPKGAIVFCINGSKCRTNRARVVDIEYMIDVNEFLRDTLSEDDAYTAMSQINLRPVRSMYDSEFYYIIGQEIEISDFNLQYNVECGKGIHFFLKKEEAINFRY